MCKKLKGCANRIDRCIKSHVDWLNRNGFKTILSCCGHGKYPKTILLRFEDNRVYDLFSLIELKPYNPKIKKQYNRYYKKDAEGYHYIPEIINAPWIDLGQVEEIN